MNVSRPAERAIQHTASTPDQVAGEVKRTRRRNRKRTRNATALRRINALARERQEAWAAETHELSEDEFRRTVELGQRDLTRALATKLNREFDELRRARGDEYRGKTSEARG